MNKRTQIFKLSAGRDGHVNLSRSVLADWLSPARFCGEVANADLPQSGEQKMVGGLTIQNDDGKLFLVEKVA